MDARSEQKEQKTTKVSNLDLSAIGDRPSPRSRVMPPLLDFSGLNNQSSTMSTLNTEATRNFQKLRKLFNVSVLIHVVTLILTLVALLANVNSLYTLFPFCMTFSLAFVLEVITLIQKIRKRNLWLIKFAVYFRLAISGAAALLGFLGILWALLGTTNDGGGWGRGDWTEFIGARGRE